MSKAWHTGIRSHFTGEYKVSDNVPRWPSCVDCKTRIIRTTDETLKRCTPCNDPDSGAVSLTAPNHFGYVTIVAPQGEP